MSAASWAQGQKLFGTDGVRETANSVLTPELALDLGRAGAFVLAGGMDGAGASRIAVGRDTRISGEMLSAALAAGAMSVGVDVVDLGVFPTPGVAYLTRVLPAAAGAVISASHNPFPDNGIKYFGRDGTKLSDQREDEIAAYATAHRDTLPRPHGAGVGRLSTCPGARDLYLSHVLGTAALRLGGVRVVIDAANGSMSGFASEALERLGARVLEIAAKPDGTNINDGCGSTHPERVAAEVVSGGFDLGLSFDGDGDRMVAVDGGGRTLDGDDVLAIVGHDLLGRGLLPNCAIAATVMSNMGLDALLASAGGRVVRTPVGDRHVYLAMRDEGLSVGGEQSGHIIFLDHHTTGDGLITAVQLLAVLARRGETLAEAASRLVRFPQVQRNVRLGSRSALTAVAGREGLTDALRRAELALGASGRVVLRPSGTEPVMRVMVEARDEAMASKLADDLVAVIERESGSQADG